MTNRDGLVQRGRLMRTFASGFWTPSLTQTDPQIPYLPLESVDEPPPPGGTALFRMLMGVGT